MLLLLVLIIWMVVRVTPIFLNVQERTIFYEKSILKPSILESDRFGIDVATNGKFVVVTADYDDDNGNNAGSAYVYRLQDKPVIEFDNINKITTKHITFNTSNITLQLNGTNHGN